MPSNRGPHPEDAEQFASAQHDRLRQAVRDTAYRDVNPIRGTYRIVRQTDEALGCLVRTLRTLGPSQVIWHLDRSIANVGRVQARLQEIAADEDLGWCVEQGDHVDATLRNTPDPVATSDSAILEATDDWSHLGALVLVRLAPEANLVDLRPDGERVRWRPNPSWQAVPWIENENGFSHP